MAYGENHWASSFLDDLNELPTLSSTSQAVIEAMQRPGASFQMVSALVERDPALAARLLKVANSAFYPSMQRVSNLRLALSRLGIAEVGQLVMASSLLMTFGGAQDTMDWQAFWEHSFASGIASHIVADPGFRGFAPVSLGENPYFVAGLVHHVGILVEHLRAPELFDQARKMALKDGTSLHEAETKVFGFSHAEVGGVLLQRWRLREDVVDAAFAHHDPDSYTGAHAKTVAVVHLSAMLVHELGHSRSFEGAVPPFSQKALFGLGWRVEQIPELKERVQSALDRASHLWQALSEA